MGFAGVPGNSPVVLLCPLIFLAGFEQLMGRLVSLVQLPSAPPAMLACLPAHPACACLFAGGGGRGEKGFAVNLQAFGVGRGHIASPTVSAPSKNSPAAPASPGRLCLGHAGHPAVLAVVGRDRGSCWRRMDVAGDWEAAASRVPSSWPWSTGSHTSWHCQRGRGVRQAGSPAASAPLQPLSREAGPWPAGMMEQMMLLV